MSTEPASTEPQLADPASGNGAPPLEAARTIEVENPATGQIAGSVPNLDAGEIAEAAARARAAQPQWQAFGFDGRGAVIRRCQVWLLQNFDRVAEVEISETGKTQDDVLLEVAMGAGECRFWRKHAERYLADERIRSESPFMVGRKLMIRYQPLGVVGVIGPWNYPIANNFGDSVPALMAGNTVLLKPSEQTPLTSLLMREMFIECGGPADVFQVVNGDGATGAALIDEVDFVMFTGSTATGTKVMERAAQTLTPVSLELGGKDPMIVLSDADVERAVNVAVFSSMQNSGQTCISTERVYVEAPIYDEFVDGVAKKVEKLRQGLAAGAGTVDVGSMTFPPQVDLVDDHVQDAVSKGARVLTGGHRGGGVGHFYEPTVLVDVDHSMKAMTEETFGPTLPIMKVQDEDEAVRLANDSRYGLQASIFTKDLKKGERLARQIEAGSVTVNDSQINYGALELPMGGWKESGIGARHGLDGIRKYTKKQSIVIARWGPKREIYHMPYGRLRSGMFRRIVSFVYGRQRRVSPWFTLKRSRGATRR